MPLVPPALDDRQYEALATALLARIPVHTPEWTDFNESDPGIALLELFAFLAQDLGRRARTRRRRGVAAALIGVGIAATAWWLIARASGDDSDSPEDEVDTP